jgi:subtilisin-like proprotein convertase family protein
MRDVIVATALAVIAGCASAGAGGDASPPDASATPIDGAPDEPDALVPDAIPSDAMISSLSLTDDVAADFVPAASSETTVEAWGAVAPVAYYTGGLLQRASDTGIFVDPAATTWATIQGYTATGKNAITWLSQAQWGSDTPPSVGLTNPDDFTTWFEGEIWLEAGAWSFSLRADDHGFVEIAAPGGTSFLRVLNANWDVAGTGSFTATATGWHPFRFAVAEQGGGAEYTLQFSGPGVGLQTIPRDRFRARADALTGLVQAGFDDSRGTGDVDTTIDTVGPGNTNWNTGNPGDLGMTASDTFSVRWTGQVRIDVAGTYTFRYSSDDGQRLWIDGIKRLDAWSPGDATANNVTQTITLAAGWHDLVIEQTEAAGSAAAFLTVESGPDGVGQPLPVARLRPVEARSDRLCAGSDRTDRAIPDYVSPNPGTVSSTVAVTAPSNAVVTSVDVSFQYTHTFRGDLVFSLRAPNGTQVTVYDPTGAGSGTYTDRFVVTGFVGTPVNGTWTFVVQDTVGQDTGTLLDVEITPHYTGGEAPIPAMSWFESSVRDLGAGVVAIDTVNWTERLPAGSDVSLRVRTCATPEECAAATWSAPITTSGGAPGVAPARYLQYRIDFTTDGDHAPALEMVRIDYRATS